MTNNLQEALQRMTALPGVLAGFVFDGFPSVRASHMPAGWEAPLLKTLAQQMLGFAEASQPKKQAMQEVRVTYGQGTLHVKFFGQGGGCALFLSKEADLPALEQPLKLGAVVLQKALNAAPKEETALGQMAAAAEQALAEAREDDATFTGVFRRLCFQRLGPFGNRLFDEALEKESLTPPLRNEEDKRRLVNAVLEGVPHPVVKPLLAEKAEELLRTEG